MILVSSLLLFRQLPLHIPRGSLPVQLGGTLEPGHHDTWLENCAKLMTRNCDLECEDVVSMDRVNGTTHIEIVSNPKQVSHFLVHFISLISSLLVGLRYFFHPKIFQEESLTKIPPKYVRKYLKVSLSLVTFFDSVSCFVIVLSI